jgi:Flp pilus assembly protein TadD
LGQRGKAVAGSVAVVRPKPGDSRSQTANGTRKDALHRNILGWVGIVLAALIVYWPALHGTVLWDDNAHITSPALQSLDGLWRIWFELGATQQYYPLLHTAFWLEHRLWGDAVLGYHLVNLFEHCLSACLLVAILRQLKLPARVAWLSGLIFALHPVCVEAVAWMSEQKSTLSGVFYLAAALTYLHFDSSRRRSLYFAALGLFVLALLSKSVTATLPAALLVVFWWERGKIDWKRDILPLAPWFVIGATSGLFTAWVERTYIGAQGAGYELTFAEHILLAGRIACFYAGKILWPADLMFSYPRWDVDPAALWQWAYPVIVTAVAISLMVLARKMRGPLASFLFFSGTLFPVLGFMHVFPFRYSYVADHFQYLATLGIIVPGAWLLASTATRRGPSKTLAKVATVALPCVLGILTWRQSGFYANAETLYRATLQRNPGSWMTHNNLGIVYAEQGRLPEAVAEFTASLRLKPDHGKAHMNLGNVLRQMPGHMADAIVEYQTALLFEPNLVLAHKNLAIALAQNPARLPEAVSEFQAALRLDPEDAQTHALLAITLAQAGRMPEALDEYRTALHLQPNDADTRLNYADTLSQLPGQQREAGTQYRLLLKESPDSPAARTARVHLQALDGSNPPALLPQSR